MFIMGCDQQWARVDYYLNNGVLEPGPHLQLPGEQAPDHHPHHQEHLGLQPGLQIQNIHGQQVYGQAKRRLNSAGRIDRGVDHNPQGDRAQLRERENTDPVWPQLGRQQEHQEHHVPHHHRRARQQSQPHHHGRVQTTPHQTARVPSPRNAHDALQHRRQQKGQVQQIRTQAHYRHYYWTSHRLLWTYQNLQEKDYRPQALNIFQLHHTRANCLGLIHHFVYTILITFSSSSFFNSGQYSPSLFKFSKYSGLFEATYFSFISFSRFLMVQAQQNKETPFWTAESEQNSSADTFYWITYYFVNLWPSRSWYSKLTLRSISGRVSGFMGSNLTRIKPPKLSTSPGLSLLSLIYDGNTDENLLMMKLSPYLAYVLSSSAEPNTLMLVILSDCSLSVISWTQGKKVQSNRSLKQVCKSFSSTAQKQLKFLTSFSFSQVDDWKSLETPIIVVPIRWLREISQMSRCQFATELSHTSVNITMRFSYPGTSLLNLLTCLIAQLNPLRIVVPPDSKFWYMACLTSSLFILETKLLSMTVLAVW